MTLRARKERVFLLGGEREGHNTIPLSDQFSPSGSVNMRQSKFGQVEMVNGYAILNSTAVTTDTGADNVATVGVYHYRSFSGGSVTRREVIVVDDGTDEVEIWHSTDDGATFLFLRDLGSGAVGLIPSFAQYENNLFIAFGGAVAVQKYDGTTVADAGQTQPAAPSVATGAAGVLNGIFSYKTSEIDGSNNVGPASAAVTIQLIDQQANLSSITLGANGARIWRTRGDGDVYYRLADVTGTTHTDDLPDTTLIDNRPEPDNIGDPPPTGSRVAVSHRARVFYLGTDANPNRFNYGDIGIGDSVGVDNFERVGEGEQADEIITAWPEYEGELAIFKEYSIWLLAGDGRATFNLIRTQASIGTISKHSVALVPGEATFNNASGIPTTTARPTLVFMTADDVRLFDGGSDIIISWDEQDTFRTLNYAQRRSAWCMTFPEYDSVLFCFPAGASTTPDTYRLWDYARGSWHPVDFLPHGASAALGETSSAANVLLVGDARTVINGGRSGGTVYQFFTGSSAAGSDITARFRSKALHFQAPELTKVLEYDDPIFGVQAGILNVTGRYYAGFADADTATAHSTTAFALQGTDVDHVNPGPFWPEDGSDNPLVDEAYVKEYEITGQTIWSLNGWTHRARVYPSVDVRPEGA